MKYSVITFGCRVNQADSLGFEEEFLARGARPASPEEADIVVVNTCSVTGSADQGARQTIRRVARSNPRAKIIVTGCYATRQPGEVGELTNVARVVPNPEKPRLVSLIVKWSNRESTTAERFGDGEGGCGAVIEPGTAGRTAFTLCVQTGCSEPCSYCIIPTTRGGPQSRPLDQVLPEIERVAGAGFKEVAITGVHLGSYGRDINPASSLVELLRAIADRWGAPTSLGRGLGSTHEGEPRRSATPGCARVHGTSDLVFRISSLEPNDCTADIVRLVAESGCFAPHFHLPLQHASARMLEAMRRPYTIEAYSALVDDIRRRIPHAALGSDIIVGFPGETEEDFERLTLFLERSPLTHVHVFPYSDRPGTVAAAMSDKVSGTIVRSRASRVREISNRLSKGFREGQAGAVHRALTLEDGSLAVTGNYLKVRIPPGKPRNEWVTVELASASGVLSGVVLDR